MRVLSPLNSRYLIIILVIVFMMSFSILVSPVKASSTILYPVADSYVNSQYPNNNYGTQNTLRITSDGTTRRAYIKFDLTSIPVGQAVSSAILKLYCTAASPTSNVELDVYATSDSWSETGITWNNAPAVGALIVANLAVGPAGYYYSWDITSYVAAQYSGDKIASVVVKFPQDCYYQRDFYSKEKSGTSYDPYLQIVYTQQYYLTVTSPYDSPTPSSGWFASGTSITASVTSPVAGPSGTRYVCTGWTGTGSVISGSGTSVTFSITQTSSITWNWKTQYYLTVSSSYGSPSPTSEWFDAGTPITVSVTSPVAGPAGTRYVCTGWTGTGSVPSPGTGTSVSFNINAPSSVTWNWKTQYLLTVLTSPGGLNPPPTRNPTGEAGPANGWWYDTSVSVQLTAQSVTGYTFDYWDVDLTSKGAGVNPISVSMGAPHTATAHYTVEIPQYYLTVSSSYDSPSPTSGLFASETYITASVTSPWPPAPAGTRYVCTGWTGTGSVPSSGTGTSVSFTITQPSSITWNWKTQYYLTVSSPYGTPGGEGWYDSGDTAYATVSPLIVPGSTGVQYVFTSWSGDASGTTSPSDPILMGGPKTAIANWKTQYYLTVTSAHGTTGGEGWYNSGATAYAIVSPLIVSGPSETRYAFTHWSDDASGTTSPSDPILMNGPKTATGNWKTQYYLTVSSPYGTTGGEGWYDDGDTAHATLDTGTVDHGNGTRRVFTNWGGGASGTNYVQSDPITMDGPKTAMGNWKTQYYLTVISLHGTTGGEGWYDSGATAYATVSPLIVSGPSGTQYVFTHWSGDASGTTSPSDPIIMGGPKTAIANWKTQYYLIVSSAHGTPGGEGWYNSGDTAYATVSPLIVPGSTGVQYVFTSWSGDASGTTSPSDPILMGGPKTAVGNWKTQYYLTVSSPSNSPPYGSPTPTSGWFDAETPITASVTSPWPGPYGTRYVCTGWTGTGSVPLSGTETSVTFTINEPSSITWNWKTQYLLTVRTSPPGLSPQPTRNPVGEAGPPDGWWYDTSVSVQLTAQSVTGHTFDYWDVDGSSKGSGVNPISVSMNAPHTAIAYYTALPQQYYLTLVTNPYGIASLVGEGWYDADVYASISAPEFVDIVVGASRYKFNGWTTADMAEITNPSALSTTVLMDKSKTVTANYIVQYYLTVSSAHGTPGGEGWYNSGATAYATVSPLIVSGPAGTRYVFTHWSGDASGTTSPSDPILMNGPKTAVANWKTQYYLTVKTDPLGLVSIPGEGWYDVSYSVSLTAPLVGGYTFLNWDVDGTPKSGNPISVVMDGSHTATAHYQGGPRPVGGYSVSLDQPLETAPLVGYTMILAMLGAAVSLIRRKRK